MSIETAALQSRVDRAKDTGNALLIVVAEFDLMRQQLMDLRIWPKYATLWPKLKAAAIHEIVGEQ